MFFQAAILTSVDILNRSRPDLLVFRVTPHEFLQFVLMEVAKFKRIEVLHFQPCSLAPAMLPRLESGNMISLRASSVAHSGHAAEILEIYREQIRRLASGETPAYMTHQRARDYSLRTASSKAHAFASSAKWIFANRFPSSLNFTGHPSNLGFIAGFMRVLLTRSLQTYLRNSSSALGRDFTIPEKFSVFAMHYEPERTSLPDGLPIDSQMDAIFQSLSTLAPGEKLVVKEHYSQQSSALRGFLGRSPEFYRLASRLPGVVFAPIETNLTVLVTKAERVFTLTGTIGIEAALKGTQVVYYGSPWWAGMPGSSHSNFTESASGPGTKVPVSRAAVFSFLENLISTQMVPGLASEDPAVLEKRLGPLPPLIQDLEVDSISSCIADYFSATT